MQTQRTGIILMLSAAFLFGVGNFFVKLASTATTSSWEVVFIRGAGGLLFAWLLLRFRGQRFAPVDKRMLFYRGLLGALSLFCVFYGIKYSSLTKATLLSYTFPVFGTLFTLLLYREHPQRGFWPLFLLALAGILLIVKPDNGRFVMADLVPLAGGVISGGAVTAIRQLRHTDKPETVFASFMLFSVLLSTPFAAGKLHPLPAINWVWLLGMVVTTSLAQVQMSRAYHSLKVSQGSMIQLLAVPFSALWAMLFLGEKNSPGVLVGGAMVLTATALIMVSEKKEPVGATKPDAAI